ncbi:hypothetical protein ACETIH_17550 [Microvirga arabica]|uniref:Uncharacterized protein n=1 Tax=Microvirga arabica TaxID=1128671 RepID=A0ABV6YB23_9HYPH
MPNHTLEWEHLVKTERDIVEGEWRVTRQMLLIEKLRQAGHATAEAEKLLLTLEDTLEDWWAHRDEILRNLERHSAIH